MVIDSLNGVIGVFCGGGVGFCCHQPVGLSTKGRFGCLTGSCAGLLKIGNLYVLGVPGTVRSNWRYVLSRDDWELPGPVSVVGGVGRNFWVGSGCGPIMETSGVLTVSSLNLDFCLVTGPLVLSSSSNLCCEVFGVDVCRLSVGSSLSLVSVSDVKRDSVSDMCHVSVIRLRKSTLYSIISKYAVSTLNSFVLLSAH